MLHLEEDQYQYLQLHQTTSLGPAQYFLWNDVEGNVSGHESGGDLGLNGTLVNGYSTTTTSVVKNY